MSALSRYHGAVHDSSHDGQYQEKRRFQNFKIQKVQNSQSRKIIPQIRHFFLKYSVQPKDLSVGFIVPKG